MQNMRVNLVAVCSVKRKSKHVYLGHSFSQNDNFLFLNQQNARREKTFMNGRMCINMRDASTQSEHAYTRATVPSTFHMKISLMYCYPR